MVTKMFSHYTCCKLRDLGGQENWSKKWCQQSSKITPKSSFGHPGVRFLRCWEGLIKVRFLMIFGAAQKIKKIWKKEAEVWKENLPRWVRRKRRDPQRAFGVCKVKQIRQSLQTKFGTPCPLRAGGGGLLSLREFRRPCFFKDLGLRTFVLWKINPKWH